MEGKTLVITNPDGSESSYLVGLVTLDQAEEVLSSDPPLSPKQQQRKLVSYATGTDESKVGALPYLHFGKIFEAALDANGMRAAKGGDGMPSGESPITAPSGPS